MTEHQHEHEESAVARGAWYADPYEIADQRWWNGGKWTDAVRQTPRDDTLASQPPVSMGKCFPVNMQTVVGEMLRVVPTDRAPSRQLRRELGLSGLRAMGAGASLWTPSEFEVLAAGGLVASLSFGGVELVRLASAEGAWSVQKQRRRGGDLVITSSAAETAGWFFGGHWRAGGTIALTTGTEVTLRRAADRHWKLRMPDIRETLWRSAPIGMTSV